MKARIFLLVGQGLDALTFAAFFLLTPPIILASFEKSEQNPIVAAIFAIGGVGAVVFVKVGLAAFVIYRDSKRIKRPKLTGALMGVAGISGYIGATFNSIALKTVMGW